MLHRQSATLSTKLTASATTLLMLAMLLASAQALTPQELNTFMALANAGVTGNYVPLTTLSAKFATEATALKNWANELHNNGGDQSVQAFLKAHKAQFFQPISLTVLEAKYKAAVKAGYEGTLDEYAKVLRGATVTQRQVALTQMNQIGLYKVMLQTAAIFAAASAQAAELAENQHRPHIVPTSYHPSLYFYFVLPHGSCLELIWAGALFAYSGLLLDGMGIGLAFQVVGIGIGVAYGYYC